MRRAAPARPRAHVVSQAFLQSVVRDAALYAEHAKRKTLSAADVVYALKRQGKPIYGFGG